MADLIGAIITAFAVAFFSIPSIIRVAELKNLHDVPEDRKKHGGAVPTLGGIAIFAGFVLAFFFWIGSRPFPELRYIMCSVIIVFFVGIRDDLMNTPALKKLLAQVIAALIIIHWGGVRLQSLYGILGIYEIAVVPSYLLSLTAIVGITNAFNLVDGIDTLAGSLGVLVTCFFAGWFAIHGFYSWAVFSGSLLGALLAYLWFNRTPARIFMGDTGSLILGLVCAVMAIKFIEINRIHNYTSSAATIAISVMIVPLYDTVRVMTVRLWNRRSPFHPDRNHLHHLLTDLSLTHVQATAVLVSVNLAIAVLAFTCRDIGDLLGLQDWNAELLLLIVILLVGAFSFLVGRKTRSERAREDGIVVKKQTELQVTQ